MERDGWEWGGICCHRRPRGKAVDNFNPLPLFFFSKSPQPILGQLISELWMCMCVCWSTFIELSIYPDMNTLTHYFTRNVYLSIQTIATRQQTQLQLMGSILWSQTHTFLSLAIICDRKSKSRQYFCMTSQAPLPVSSLFLKNINVYCGKMEIGNQHCSPSLLFQSGHFF